MRLALRVLPLAAFVSIAACADFLFGSDGYYFRPKLDFPVHSSLQVMVLTPDTVASNTLFAVSATTIGGGCVRRAGEDAVSESATGFTIELVDHNTGMDVCTSDLRHISHPHTLTFGTPGTYSIRFVGAAEPTKLGRDYTPVVIERTVVVLPAP